MFVHYVSPILFLSHFFHTPDDGTSGAPAPGGDAGYSSGGTPSGLDFNAFDDYMNGGPNSPGGREGSGQNLSNKAPQTPPPPPAAPSGTPIQGAQQTGATQAPGTQQPGTAPPPAAPPAPDRLPPPPPDLFALPGADPTQAVDPQARIAQLESYIQTMSAYVQGMGQQQPQAQPQPQAPGDPRTGLLYNSTVDPALIQALNSDDPAQQGAAFAYALNAQATQVHRNLAREVGSYLRDTLVPNLIQHMEGRHQQREYERNVQGEFYGRHSDLNHPPYRAVVVSVAQQMIRQAESTGAWQGWTPQFADAVANNSRRLLGQRPPGTGGAPGFTPTGSRPGSVGGPSGDPSDPNSPEAIQDLMGDFGY